VPPMTAIARMINSRVTELPMSQPKICAALDSGQGTKRARDDGRAGPVHGQVQPPLRRRVANHGRGGNLRI
jgi:hypothetical protein